MAMVWSRAAETALPPAFVALEAATRAALDAVGDAAEWSAGTRAGVLAWTARHRDQMAVLEGRVVTAERQAGTWALKGDRDLAGFVGRVSRGGRGAGFAAVDRAATLQALPAVAEALADGPVTETHVAQLTRATAVSPRLAAELATDAGQERVVALARRFDAPEFGKQLRVMAAELDPRGLQRSHDEQRANRFLTISHTPGGALVKAQLDSVAGYELSKAIGALNPRPAKDDDRDAGQRRADALMAMVHRTLADDATTPGAAAPVQAIVTMTQETWAALRAGRRGTGVPRRGAAVVGGPAAGGRGVGRAAVDGAAVDGTGFGESAPAPSRGSTEGVLEAMGGVPPVRDEGGRSWPASEVARALCDCVLTRAVVDADGVVLDLGRGERLFGRRHWMALLAGGVTGCAWPDCAMPLRNTELHHLSWWDRDGGPTDMANCGPYCRFHHDWIHSHDIAVTRLDDGRYEHRDRHGRLIGIGGPPAGGRTMPNAGAAAEVGPGPATDGVGSAARHGVRGEQPSLWGAADETAEPLGRTG